MSSNNIFPLEEIVHIDPDHCKSLMPEWDNYVKKDSLNAGGFQYFILLIKNSPVCYHWY